MKTIGAHLALEQLPHLEKQKKTQVVLNCCLKALARCCGFPALMVGIISHGNHLWVVEKNNKDKKSKDRPPAV